MTKRDSLRDIAGLLPGVVYQYLLRPDGSHCMPFSSAAIRDIFGLGPEDVREDATSIFALIHPDDLKDCQDSIAKSARELSPCSIRCRIRLPDGRERWILANAIPRREPDGATLWHGFLTDITDGVRRDEELRESRALIEKIIDAMPVRIFWKNRDLVYLGCNAAFAKDSGHADAKDVVGKDDFQMSWRNEAERYRADDRLVIETGLPKLLIEEPQTTPEGKSIVLLTNKIPLRNLGGEVVGVLGTYMDITERHRSAQALATIQKLESLGTLAGGIAHDFNNILTAVMGNVSLLQQHATGGDSLEIINETLSACRSARVLSNQLLTFAKGGDPIIETFELGPLLKQTAEAVTSGTNARCVYDLGEIPMLTRIDRSQIAQVVRSLLTNSIEAMPLGGDIRLQAAVVATSTAGRFVRLEISDQGPGVAPKNLTRLFDPYFSTKGPGRGLGLATSLSIMRRHGGNISFELRPTPGAHFILHFPMADELERSRKPASSPPADKGAILVMDDEAVVAKVLIRMLEREGYRAEHAPEGRAAVEAYARALKTKPYAAVIMDLNVQDGMGGQEAVREILRLDPKAKVIVSSGYSNDPLLTQFAAQGFLGALAKPYTLQEVSETLRRLLGTN